MQALKTQGVGKNQLRNGTSGVCCHAPTLVISLLALQTCIALAYTTPAPIQRCPPARVRSWKKVTAGVGRSDNYRSHNQEHFHADHNDCQRTHLRDKAMKRNKTQPDLRAERCDFLINSDSLYTPCQTPYCSGTCMSTEMLQYHRPYYDDTNLTLSCPVGTSFFGCHQSSNSLLNTNIHDTFSLPAHVCNELHMPCSTADCHVCVHHDPLQVEPCFDAAKVQQTSFYQYMQTHSLPSAGTTISALQAFSSTSVYYAPRLPSATPLGQHAIRLYWLVASGMHTVHAKLLPIIQSLIPTTQPHVQCSWHQHCHDVHVSSEEIQAVKTLTSDMHMQRRSLAEWELTGKIILQTCKHISFALVGLVIPCAVTVAAQAIHVLALVSIILLQSIMKLTKQHPGSVCSAQYCITSLKVCTVSIAHLGKKMGQRTCYHLIIIM